MQKAGRKGPDRGQIATTKAHKLGRRRINRAKLERNLTARAAADSLT
jgi:hypothetical protein